MNESKKTFVLAILDGWGFSTKKVGNPIAEANKPNMDMLNRQYPMILLQASGLAVGIPWGQSGNSEVGHLNIGAGRIVEQSLSRINRAIENRDFFSNPAIVGVFDQAKKNNSKIHLIGLLTSGSVHASFPHITALMDMAGSFGQTEVYLHLFLDGKDSGLHEAPILIDKLQTEIKARGHGKIATLIGRNFAMDRDNNWNLTLKTYELLTKATGENGPDVLTAINNHYAGNYNDSNIPPTVITSAGFSGISDGDALMFFNFREESMRQLLRPFIEPDFSIFPKKELKDIYICTMTQYLESPSVQVAFMPLTVPNCLSEILALNQKKQLHISETEKYAHVSYFFNGLNNNKFDGETDIFIESNKDHLNKPEMKSLEIANTIIQEIDKNDYDFIVLNFANADILAHTGNYQTAVTGIEAVDNALGLILSKVIDNGGTMIVTADHGNAESLTYKVSGEAETKHNDNPVPFYLINAKYQTTKTSEQIAQETKEIGGILGDVAPTILELMGLPQPAEMTGKSLLSLLEVRN